MYLLIFSLFIIIIIKVVYRLCWIDFSTSILFSNRNSPFYQMDWNMCKVNGDWDYYCVLIFWEEVTSSVHKSLLYFFCQSRIKIWNKVQSMSTWLTLWILCMIMDTIYPKKVHWVKSTGSLPSYDLEHNVSMLYQFGTVY